MTDSDDEYRGITAGVEYGDVLDRAVETWGEQFQIDLTIEECGELTTELARRNRGREDEEAIVEELADVRIMVDQLAVVFGEERVRAVAEEKVERIERRIEEEWATD